MIGRNTNLAILFADISGSTKLFETLGDAAARHKVAQCLALLAEIVKRHKGAVIKTIGDEVMCTFTSAEGAVTAACDMHETLEDEATELTAHGPVKLRIRVGLQYGPAIQEKGDVFGDSVNVASRMVSQAKAGQIITTQQTVDLLPPTLRASARFIDRAPVKGKKETIDLYEIIWQEEDVTRMSTGIMPAVAAPKAKLQLTYRKSNVVLNEERSAATLGRSTGADIAVEETLASRMHVRIELRRGKFFIVDQSTNGTYIKSNETGNETFLRREEAPLTGSGQISLGRAFNENPVEIVKYHTDA